MAKTDAEKVRSLGREEELWIYFQHEDIGPQSPALLRDGGTQSTEPKPPTWGPALPYGESGPLIMQVVCERLRWCEQRMPKITSVLRANYVELTPRDRLKPKQDVAREQSARVEAAKRLYDESRKAILYPPIRDGGQAQRRELSGGGDVPRGSKSDLRRWAKNMLSPLLGKSGIR